MYTEVEREFTRDLDWETSTDRDQDFRRTYPRRYYDFAVRWMVNSIVYHKTETGKVWTRLKLKAKIMAGAAGMWLIKAMGE